MRNFIVFCFSIITGTAMAQMPGFSLVEDVNAFSKAFTAAAAKTQTIQADFVQEKNLAMVKDKMTSKGKFWYKNGSKVRMEYTHPYKYLMVLNNGQVYVNDGRKASTTNAESNRMYQQVNKLIMDCMQGAALTGKDFNAKVFEGPGKYIMNLTPKNKSLQKYFSNVRITVLKADMAVESINFMEAAGDYTQINFTNRVINQPIADATFANR